MALINKTAADTLARMGPGCVSDLMELFSPKDKTKEGTMLLALAVNATRSTEFVPAMLAADYKIQPDLIEQEGSDGMIVAAMQGRSLAGLGALCFPKMSTVDALIAMPPGAQALRLFQEAMALGPLVGSKAPERILMSALRRDKSGRVSLRDERPGAILSARFAHAKGMLIALAGNPEADAASFGYLASQDCFDLVEQTLLIPEAIRPWFEATPEGKAYCQILDGDSGMSSRTSTGHLRSQQPALVAKALAASWQAQCQEAVMAAVSAAAIAAPRGRAKRL